MKRAKPLEVWWCMKIGFYAFDGWEFDADNGKKTKRNNQIYNHVYLESTMKEVLLLLIKQTTNLISSDSSTLGNYNKLLHEE